MTTRGTTSIDEEVEAGLAPPLHRLPSRSGRTPIALAVVIAASLGVLVWAPWGRTTPAGSTASAAPVALSGQTSGASSPPGVAAAPSTLPSGPPVAGAAIARYSSLVDNEWTVVALLTLDAAPPSEEPAIQHVAVPPPSPDGPFQVLQQGLTAVMSPVERSGHPDAPCVAPAGSRDRTAVHLPAGRVVYLGVTFPGMNPRAAIAASVLGRPGITIVRVSPIVVALAGMPAERRYTVPSSGSGGTILFGLAPPNLLPSEAYRFTITAPGLEGPTYLYACIGL